MNVVERLAEALHDGPLQELGAQSITLQLLERAITDPVASADLLESIDAGRRATRQIHALMSEAVLEMGCETKSNASRSEPVDHRSVFEQSPALFLLLDPDLTIIDASDAYLAATMTTRDGIVGLHVFEAFPDNPDDPDSDGTRNLGASLDRVRYQKVADAMAFQKYDVRRPEAEGGEFEVRYWSPLNTPVLSQQGDVVAIVHRVEDVTELMRLRESAADGLERTSELQERSTALEEQLFRRTEELERANERLMELDRLKSDFLSRMSHELRTPLNAVIGFAQLLGFDDLDQAQTESVDNIMRAGHLLLDLINEVLDITQIEAGRLNLSIEPVQLSEVLDAAATLVMPAARRSSITLTTDEVGDHLYAMADRQRLLQILLNLYSNAVKYNSSGGSISVAIDWTPDRVRIAVHDTGPGIAEADRDRLFAPFDRLGKEQTEIEGTGVGLMLARRLAEHMGGGLHLVESGAQGSTFSLDLPAAEAPEMRDSGTAPNRAALHVATGPVRILYIEDNLSNLRLIDAIFAKLTNVELLTAMQGRIGIELAVEHRPDLILLDVHLPDINGDEVLRLLRAQPATEHTRVVFLSADATPHHVQRLTAMGADGYLTKPIEISELLEVVETSRRRDPVGAGHRMDEP